MIDLPPHKVSCPTCGRTYLVDLALVPASGARIACRRCGERFEVHKPTADTAVPAPTAKTPTPASRMAGPARRPAQGPGSTLQGSLVGSTLPPEAVARRRVWVFPDDPALQRPGVLQALKAALSTSVIEVIDADSRIQLSQAAHERDEWPDVVVFGDMPVLLEDRLLRTVATRENVLRVLVSTHFNPELVRTAQQYCGFDRHLALPLTPSDLRMAFERPVGST